MLRTASTVYKYSLENLANSLEEYCEPLSETISKQWRSQPIVIGWAPLYIEFIYESQYGKKAYDYDLFWL